MVTKVDMRWWGPGTMPVTSISSITSSPHRYHQRAIPGGYAVVATSDHANDALTESAFPLHGSDDLVSWQPQVRIEYMFALLRRITMIARNMCKN